jgi:methylglutaconyl-CoA hydratase
MSSYPTLTLETAQRIATLTLNKPDGRNAMDFQLAEDLRLALERLDDQPEIKVIVLRANGTDFCAGTDPNYLFKLQQFSLEDNIGDSGFLGNVLQALYRNKRLVIAAVNGQAISEGCTLASCADIVLASDNASFSLPDARFGNIPALSIYFLLKRLSPGALRKMLLGGDVLAATDAQAISLVDYVVPAAGLHTEAHQLALRMAQQNAVGSVEFIKKMMADLPAMPHQEALQFAAKINGHGRFNAEFLRGLQARAYDNRVEW